MPLPEKSQLVLKHDHRLGDKNDHVGIIVDDKYDICQRIAAGGVGTVYRARHRFTGRQVALKLLNEQYSRDRAMSERFLREAKAAAEIGHPNIIDVVDAGVDEGVGVYVAFELLEGFDLAEALKDSSLSIRQVLEVADEVLDALDAAHQAGVIHRDIKPPNIFLVPDEKGALHVRVLDFGAAKRQEVAIEESLTTVGTVIGTPAYMSPEQASGHPVDPRTDVWSVGAVLFRAFANRPPFTERNPNLLLACIIRDTAPSLAEFRPDLPPSLISVVDQALARDPELRWQSARAMQDALRLALVLAQQHASEPIAPRTVLPTVPDDPSSVRAEPSQIPDTTIKDPSPLMPPRSRRTTQFVIFGVLASILVGGIFALIWMKLSPSSASQSESSVAPQVVREIHPEPILPLTKEKPKDESPANHDMDIPSSSVITSSKPTVPLLPKAPRASPTAPQRPPLTPIREYE